MKICFLETESGDRALFKEHLHEHTLHFAGSVDKVPQDTEVLSLFLYSKLDADFWERHPQLKLIASRSSGFDHLDLHECHKRGITVCHVPGYGDTTVAEHTFALILALTRRIRESLSANQKKQFSYESLRGIELRGRTIGVLGAGRVGMQVLKIAGAFGLKTLAYDSKPDRELAAKHGITFTTLRRLLRESDIISLHISLSKRTHHLLNEKTLASCKEGVLIINTARGALIDTNALIKALDSGQVGGAGLDVLEDERSMQLETMHLIGQQIVNRLQSGVTASEAREHSSRRMDELQGLIRNQQLLARSNVIFTPHIAFNSVEAIDRINMGTVENIRAFAKGKPQNVARLA